MLRGILQPLHPRQRSTVVILTRLLSGQCLWQPPVSFIIPTNDLLRCSYRYYCTPAFNWKAECVGNFDKSANRIAVPGASSVPPRLNSTLAKKHIEEVCKR